MRIRQLRAPSLVAMLLTLAGCYSFTTMGRARIVDPRHVEVWAAPEALMVATSSGASYRPVGEIGARYGLTSAVEFDARVTTVGVTAGPRFQLVRSPSQIAGIDLLVAPALAYTGPDKLAIELPLVGGWNLPGRHQLVLSARVAYQARFGVGNLPRPVNSIYLGGSIGFVAQVSQRFALVPEVALLTQLYADPGFNTNVANGLGIQAGIGVLFDP